MEETGRAEKARLAIRTFQIMANALILRGYYRFGGKTGQTLEKALRELSPEIYGTMNDPRIVELKGLEYVLDRLPKGVEACSRMVMTAHEDLEGTSFERITPLKRRRVSYRVTESEMSFVVSRGLSEIYDVLTHLTFLYVEAKKIQDNMKDRDGNVRREWKALEDFVARGEDIKGKTLDQAIWNLSILIGRTYHETRETYEYMEELRTASGASNGLFHIIYSLGRITEEEIVHDNPMTVHFTPSLTHVILHQIYGKKWAGSIREKLKALGLQRRPLHIISANMHSVVNLLYGYAATESERADGDDEDLFAFFHRIRNAGEEIKAFARDFGFQEMDDTGGSEIDCQIIDTEPLRSVRLHPRIGIDKRRLGEDKPVLFVMDYAFGTQAFEVMDELLQPWTEEGNPQSLNVKSISVMGKAGILPGKKGDIMVPSAHVFEGTPHNYQVENDLVKEDFEEAGDVYVGTIITVLGTSLQNRYVLAKFHESTWKAVGLEMEGGHYQRAINAAKIRGHLSKDVQVRYAYYASDNPLLSGETLASGSMGAEGIKPTYGITKVLVEKMLN